MKFSNKIMARPLRIEFPDAIYHVTARGNEKRKIFLSASDFQYFLNYIEKMVKPFQINFLAYTLMPNHYHLLLQTLTENLSKFMHQLNTAYTVFFNWKYTRVGHLLQGRFKSLIVQKNPYLLEVSRYLHLNPYRAGLVERPQDYRWSSCRFYAGHSKPPCWLNTNFILNMLNENESNKRSTYRKFIIDGMKKIENPFAINNSQIVIGSQEYIEEIKTMVNQQPNSEIPSLKELIKNVSCEDICAAIAKLYKRDPRHLPPKQARYSLERKLAIYLLRAKTDMSLMEIGKIFNISYSAVTQIANIISERLKNDQQLLTNLRKIDDEIES